MITCGKKDNVQVREKVLSIIVKIMQYGPPDLLEALLKGIPISSFVASLLGSRDTAVQAVGVRLSELLMLKLPAIFTTMFLKEGVFHSLEQLAREAPVSDRKASKRSSSRLKVKLLDSLFWHSFNISQSKRPHTWQILTALRPLSFLAHGSMFKPTSS